MMVSSDDDVPPGHPTIPGVSIPNLESSMASARMSRPELNTILQTELTLTLQSDSSFTLDATTHCPDSCYQSAGATVGVPSGVVLVPEALGVTLAIKREGEVCTDVITAVHHQVTGLKLGPENGHRVVIAFVTVDGKVAGTATIAVPEV